MISGRQVFLPAACSLCWWPARSPSASAGGARTRLRGTSSRRISVELPVAGEVRPGAGLMDRRGTALRMPIRVGEKTDTETGPRWITAELTLGPLAAGDSAIEQTPGGMPKVITAIRITR